MSNTASSQVMSSNRAITVTVATVGHAILLFGVLFSTGPISGLLMTTIGGGIICGCYLLIPPSPAFLPICNFFAVVFLLLQGVGACSANCGGFVDYNYMWLLPTLWVGVVFHLTLMMFGVARLNKLVAYDGLYRFGLNAAQGASLFFLVVMIAHGHWCASCAASHVMMIAQAILLIQLPSIKGPLFYGLTVLCCGLGVNAFFHHEVPYRSPLSSEEKLIGYMENMRESKDVRLAVIKMDKQTEIESVVEDTRKKKTKAAVDALLGNVQGQSESTDQHVKEESLTDRPAQTQLDTENSSWQRKDFNAWGRDDAPVTIKAHMSLACEGCQGHWKNIHHYLKEVELGRLRIEFIMSWPLVPDTHYGAQIGAHVVYMAGLLGEQELLLVLNRMFSTEGTALIEKVNAVIANTERGGERNDAVRQECLLEMLTFIEDIVDMNVMVQVYNNTNGSINRMILKNSSWITEYGSPRTPMYFYVRTAEKSGRAYNYTHNLDADVVSAFIDQGLKTSQNLQNIRSSKQ